MTDIELVIKIPKDLYEAYKGRPPMLGDAGIDMIAQSIANGTLLPKGHGDLKDELDLDLFAPSLGTDEYINDLMVSHHIDYLNGDDEDKVRAFARDLIHGCMNVIKTALTIIEAESERKEK